MENFGAKMQLAGYAEEVQPAREVPEERSKVKILLVDDTPENLVALEAALQGLDEELVLATSGREALRHLLQNEFAAILLDVKMPDMDGFETAQLIRNRPRSRGTPILFLTGYKNEEHLFRGYDLGAVDFLFKPIVPEVLRSKVAVFVELSRSAHLLKRQTAALIRQTKELQKTESRLRSLLEAAPDAMIICRPEGIINLVNSQTENLFGYSRYTLIGRDIKILVPDWTGDSTIPLDRAANQELTAVSSDGSTFPVEIRSNTVQSEDGRLITNAIRDITERKRAEEEIRELNVHLEERVRARTESLMQSNDELAQFAYVASHDLQEPVRTVSLYAQLLARRFPDVLDTEARNIVNVIINHASRMEQLIRDLLDYSKLEGLGSDHFIVNSCDSALDEALATMRLRIDETETRITRNPLPEVRCDVVQLTRLFQNLIMNSIKYRSAEKPRISISSERADMDWIVSVADNGVGIEPQYAEKIFGIFKRLDPRTDHSGNGMGLAICKKIVSRHGGRIWVESEAGKGATFKFTLPVV
jgi:PAS domain S-box-containing protein